MQLSNLDPSRFDRFVITFKSLNTVKRAMYGARPPKMPAPIAMIGSEK